MVGAQSTDEADLRSRIASVFEGPDVHQADALMGVTTDDLLIAVTHAVAKQRERGRERRRERQRGLSVGQRLGILIARSAMMFF